MTTLQAEARDALKQTADECQTLVTFNEWKSDTYASSRIPDDATIQIQTPPARTHLRHLQGRGTHRPQGTGRRSRAED